MESHHITRRRFLLAATGSVVAATQFTQIPARLSANTPNAAISPHIDPSGYTPTSHFFRQQMRPITPTDPQMWSVAINGLVQKPLLLTYDDLLAHPSVEIPCTVACIGSTIRSPLIGHALWRGIPVKDLLAQLDVMPEATHAQFTATDGYTTYVKLDDLADALLVYAMNGETLPHEHGFPVRLIVPGLYGYKMPKWIQRIEFTSAPYPGFWESRGWSTTGVVQTSAMIFAPRNLETVSGIVSLNGTAYAGERQITQIEISVDDGPWMPIAFKPAEPHSWTPWQIDWMPPTPGDYLFKVRATDSNGFTQPDSAPAFPDGSNAVQSVVVRVTA
ncbi:MAG: molybdopterin-dependent oxidoreductase [Anaerolineae bacterium]|nr:molybdopterin-dependent oxidoreductase [Anaerolineae bacterium]